MRVLAFDTAYPGSMSQREDGRYVERDDVGSLSGALLEQVESFRRRAEDAEDALAQDRAAVAKLVAERDRLANIVRDHEAQIRRMTADAGAVAELVEADKEYDAACAEWDASTYPRPADRLKAARARRAAALAKFGPPA